MCDVPAVSVAVEGKINESVARKLLREVRVVPAAIYGKRGKAHLRERIAGYNNAAGYQPWLVLVDLDQDADCAPPLLLDWTPRPAPYLCFRVVVREVEAWLLGDHEQIALLLGLPSHRIPENPESLSNPKEALVTLARHSPKTRVRDDMIPRPRSGRAVGPAYASRLMEFARMQWRPEVAARRCDSLRRAMDALKRLKNGWPARS